MHSQAHRGPASPPRAQRGYTLLELMIAVVVVAILSTLAVNAYSSTVARSRRAAVQSYMQDLANRQEQLLLDARAYATSTASPPMPVAPDDVVGHYVVGISANNAATPPSFTITATPAGRQAATDTRCGTLSLNQAGTRTESGTATVADCW